MVKHPTNKLERKIIAKKKEVKKISDFRDLVEAINTKEDHAQLPKRN
jgi:hypothetical protein